MSALRDILEDMRDGVRPRRLWVYDGEDRSARVLLGELMAMGVLVEKFIPPGTDQPRFVMVTPVGDFLTMDGRCVSMPCYIQMSLFTLLCLFYKSMKRIPLRVTLEVMSGINLDFTPFSDESELCSPVFHRYHVDIHAVEDGGAIAPRIVVAEYPEQPALPCIL